MDVLSGIVLAVVEGLTEFIQVSSAEHIISAAVLLNVQQIEQFCVRQTNLLAVGFVTSFLVALPAIKTVPWLCQEEQFHSFRRLSGRSRRVLSSSDNVNGTRGEVIARLMYAYYYCSAH
jgi:undecaprenyl pyrophosphate phosphatase UppP